MLEKDILGVCETIALKSSLGDHGRYRITKNFFHKYGSISRPTATAVGAIFLFSFLLF